jgi:hypothetical protein
MDPNRHSLKSILILPTHRLLNYYKKIRHFPSYWSYEREKDPHNDFIEKEIKKELDKREHVNRNKKQKR